MTVGLLLLDYFLQPTDITGLGRTQAEVIKYLILTTEDGLVQQSLHPCAMEITACTQQVPAASKWDTLEARALSHMEPCTTEA